MKTLFDLDVEQSRVFLRYFYSAMRNPKHGFMEANGSSCFEAGKYVSELSVTFVFREVKINVIWKTIQSEDGKMLSIETVDNGENADELLLSEFINSILLRIIAKKTQRFFRRTYYNVISGCNLPCEYWLPGFRFAPLYPEDTSRLINAERIVVIDQNVDAVDARHADEVARENAMKYSAYLSFILNIPLEQPRHRELYFLNDEDGKNPRMVRRSTQLVDDTGANVMPRKGTVCRLGELRDSVFNPVRATNQYLICPKETRKILRCIQNADQTIKDSFLYCSVLYRLGQIAGREYPTARLSYEVAAVEAIIERKGTPVGNFTEFMNNYAGEDRDFYDFIYSKVRSAHWHSGALVLSEMDFSDAFIANPGRHITFNVILKSHERTRKAILTWLNERVRFTE